MTEVFGSVYSDTYNELYRDKDYAAECDLIQEVFRRYSTSQVSKVLDLGCGTGNHALPMARRGYDVVGVERSESMLALARNRLLRDGDGCALRFEGGDIRTVDLQETFDAALMMFAVIGYQIENHDVLAALRTARKHLAQRGLLILDFWYGPAVLRHRPSERIRIIAGESGKILRAASGELDTARGTCTVQYHLWQLSNDQVIAETAETHVMRYFFLNELTLLLECSGLSLLHLGAFPQFDEEPSEATWNVLAVARAV